MIPVSDGDELVCSGASIECTIKPLSVEGGGRIKVEMQAF